LWIDSDKQTRQSYTTSRQLYQSRQEGKEEGRREVKGHGAEACLELLFPYVFTDEPKRLNGQVGRRENDDASFLSLANVPIRLFQKASTITILR
jgi:hypothetical protein